MKKIVLLTVGICAYALFSAHAQNTIIYTTYDDWTNWNGGNDGATAIDTFDYDDVTVNGIGNPSYPGVTSPDGGGSLQLNPITPGSGAPYVGGSQNYTWGPGPTTAELQAMDGPGFVAPYSAASGYGPGTLVAQSGTLLVDFTMPDHTDGGTTFTLGIWFNYNNEYGGWWATSQIDLGPVSTPNGTMEMYQAVIPYSLVAESNNLTYFQLAIVENTDYQGVNPWYVDNISLVPLVVPPTPPPVTPLFTTYDDFNVWSSAGGDLVQADNTWSVNNNPTNGLGNTISPAGSGTAGSLLLYWSSVESAFGTIASGPYEENNTAFMQAIDPGCNTANESSVAAYGNVFMDYSEPDNSGGGSYFEVGLGLSYDADGYYGVFFPSSTADLGVKDNSGYEVYRAAIPYTIKAGYYYGFAPSIVVNSDYQPTNGFHIDDITVSAAQLPLITSISLNGTSMVIQGTNALGGEPFTLLSTTNISLPLTNWPAAGAGVFSGPMSFSNAFTINPGQSPNFYSIKVTP